MSPVAFSWFGSKVSAPHRPRTPDEEVIDGPKPDLEVEQKSFVNEMISKYKVVVFSKSRDPFSLKARTILEPLVPAADLLVVEIDQRPDGAAIQNALAHITGVPTIPRVFVGGKLIGGGTDCENLQKSGELKTLLEAAGVALPVV